MTEKDTKKDALLAEALKSIEKEYGKGSIMCGVYDSILGRDIDEVLRHSVRKEPTHFLPAEGPAVLCGALIDIDDQTNRAVHIERIQKRPE